MTSHTTDRFRQAFQCLPTDVQRKAKKAYRLWKNDPYHPSLQFKQVHSIEPVYSVRIGIGWRALGTKIGDTMIWFWIGSHAEYDKMLAQL
ncbi:MAG TPA: hypothetical protein VNO14_14930 [Blastocatellia bacterium]|nr:hypothetical protein [Blastocatellia bacterium]